MTDRTGEVWFENRRVGRLREASRELYLTYDEAWLHDGPFPVSISLPLDGKEVLAHTFFSGLLPEAGVRERLCRARGIDVRDDVGLLFAIGEDCAGALSILTDESPPAKSEQSERISQADLNTLVADKGQLGGNDIQPRRFSLAGAQDKLSVIKDELGYAYPDRQHPSTHILKFETLNWVCFAETVANRMAHGIDLPVAKTEFQQTSNTALPYLEVARYDRLKTGDASPVLRLHQEDLLQALGEPVALKYESDGGPTLKQVAELLRAKTEAPISAIRQLRDWQMLNFLMGNWDGHAKNLSLLYDQGSQIPKLAPCYDMVAIEFLNVIKAGPWARKMAFRIGGRDTPEEISLENWHGFAEDLGIPKTPTVNRLLELADALPEIARTVREDFAHQHGDRPAYDQLERYISKRCRWVKKQSTRRAR